MIFSQKDSCGQNFDIDLSLTIVRKQKSREEKKREEKGKGREDGSTKKESYTSGAPKLADGQLNLPFQTHPNPPVPPFYQYKLLV